jgi:hypothetical protein
MKSPVVNLTKKIGIRIYTGPLGISINFEIGPNSNIEL